MVLFYKKIIFFLLSTTTLFLLVGCSPVGEEVGDVSRSPSSSETGDGFTLPLTNPHRLAASVVIGQADFESDTERATAADSLSYPYGNPTVVDGMLYLPDTLNNRLVGHNSVPSSYPNAADFAIGQESLTDALAGNSALQNFGMQTVTVANGKLFVTDWGNNRILIYNQRPISGPGKADVVVGQTDFGESGSDTKNNRLDSPKSLYVTGDKLIVADSLNNRVLIWNSIPTTNGAAADIVLGHSDFTTRFSNEVTASTLNFPTAVWSDGTQLFVLDAGNNRIMIWDSFPTSSNQEATAVLGQVDFTSNLSNQGNGDVPSATSLSFSGDGGGLYCNGSQLFVADSNNHRVLIWDFPLTTEKAASGLIGQDDFDLSGANRDSGITADDSLSKPTGIYQFYDKLIVTDTGNNRYLIFDSK
ncbi:MAG: hypothetical protein V3S80_01980 [Sulfurimonadaceae bacterium]